MRTSAQTRPRVPRPSRPGALRRTWARHPRVALALRAALAAALAWVVSGLLPGPAADYPYYAPMGAVIATSLTLAGSVRESLQAVAAIMLGGAIATVAHAAGTPSNPFVIALAVAVGVAVAGLRWLGAMGSWVPTAALFTLVIGQGEAYYAGVYAGLVLLGAAIGVAVTLAAPALPLAPAQEALARMRQALAAQLTDVAEALEHGGAPSREEWAARQRDLQPEVVAMRSAVAEAEESVRGNRRARHYGPALRAIRRQRRAYGRVVTLLEDLVDLLATQERADLEQVALGPDLRPLAARTLRRLAAALDSVSGMSADAGAVRAARESLAALTEAADRHRRDDRPGGGVLAASGLIMIVGRVLDAVDPALVTDEAARTEA